MSPAPFDFSAVKMTQKIAAQLLSTPVELVSEEQIGGGVIRVWRRKRAMPRLRVSIWTSSDGTVMIPSKSIEEFFGFLKKVGSTPFKIDSLVEVFSKYGPMGVLLHLSNEVYAANCNHLWQPPIENNNELVVDCENSVGGTYERWFIDRDLDVRREVLSEIPKIYFK